VRPDTQVLDQTTRKIAQRLYEEIDDFTYRLLDPDDFDVGRLFARERIEGYSEQRFKDVPGYTGSTILGGLDLVGVTDSFGATVYGVEQVLASDDIIVEIP
jgi:hypothetical protein